jgi:predicted Zn finger-like uncharacterized protein
MKIACQSCQAKYTIADEKVVGKVVKIRCKKCGATIVVNGQDEGGHAGHANEEATEIRSSTAEFGPQGGGESEAWTVNVADDDQRTMATAQIVAAFQSGAVTDETYCWRDGMGDWLPLREIEELAGACGLNGAPAFAQAPAPQSQRPMASAAVASPARSASVRPQAAAAGGGLSNLFGSSPPPAAQPAAQFGGGAAAARRAGGRAGGADLFGAAAEAGGENDVMTSAPQNAAGQQVVDDGRMTGQRNENSVLFSLNALTAADAGAKKGPGGGLLGAAEGDGSGLIDIRALSSAMATSGAKKTNHADDIMNLGGGGAFSAALAAPVLTAPPLDSGDPNAPAGGATNKKILMMGGALALLLIVGMVVMFLLLQPKAPPPLAATTPEGPASAAAPASPGSAAAAAPAATAPVAAAAAGAAVAAAESTPTKAAPPSVGARRSSGAVAGYTPPPAAPTHEAPPPSNNSSLDSLMAGAVGGKSRPAAPAAPAGGTEPFDRGAAAASLGNIAASVGSCKRSSGPTGQGHVSITFSPSGRVISAIVDQPPYAGTSVGGCVAGKFRGAHVPPFAGGNVPVGKHFSID